MTVVLKKYDIADSVYDVKELKQVNELALTYSMLSEYINSLHLNSNIG
jgi:hypothetical protein